MIANPFKSKDRLSVVALVLANLLPLGGVIFAGWDAGTIVLLYWAENLILGFYAILRIASAKAGEPPHRAVKAFIIPFFCVHYGGFCFGHGAFVLLMLGIGATHDPGVHEMIAQLRHMLLPLAALFVSHGISFAQNYIVGGERNTADVAFEMARPYARIVVLHVAIVLAALPTMLLGSPWPLVALLIVGKIVIDLVLHARSHRPRGSRGDMPRASELA